MCGIVGAIAQRNVAQILLEGLKRLEYRGYDSAGIAILNDAEHIIHRRRVLGKVAQLVEVVSSDKGKPILQGKLGIAHTRWATHGQPTKSNAHPHFSQNAIAVVHNGIIENYVELRTQLISQGYTFKSETDTEVIAHLLHQQLQQDDNMIRAIRHCTEAFKGAYALGIINVNRPNALYAVRCGSPLVIGLGIDENFIASDSMALLPVTQRFIYLEESDIAELTCESINIFAPGDNDNPVKRKVHVSTANDHVANRGKYRHYMLKEIYEQPNALAETLQGHLIEDRLIAQAFGHNAEKQLGTIKRVDIIACGTSYHAGLVGQHWIESVAGLPCHVEVASEHRYREKIVEPDTLFVAISQSGETADTLAALRNAKSQGYATTLGICNVAQSTLVREADLHFLTRAGIEIGVAATKTFTAQLVALLLLTILLADKSPEKDKQKSVIQALKQLPGIAKQVLQSLTTITKVAKRFRDRDHALFLGRGALYPIAMEGALKLKEISYVHAEAYAAGELKHGPLALVDENMPVIVVAPQNNQTFQKILSNIEEVQARGGEMYIFSDSTEHWQNNNSHPNGITIIPLPTVPDILAPIIYTFPLQLLSYHIAVLKGTDVDQPRNLAKSVTVE